ncbi:MAG: hypothetical protein IPH24_16855 [Crocinitomicaceae bacterium]|nr:hypothetical protein [Crocinitomicaceae bacterium]
MSDLLSLYKEFKELESKFETETSNPDLSQTMSLESDMKEAYKKLKLAIIDELRVTNDFYQKIHEQNMLLVSNKSFELKVTKTRYGQHDKAKFTTRFEGGIMSNGYLYFRSVETNAEFTFDSYATKLIGTIDEHGATEVEEYETTMAFLRNLPAYYEARINMKGEVHLEVTEAELSVDSSLIAFELAGDPFNRNEKKRKLFLRNRSEMNRLISERIADLARLAKG